MSDSFPNDALREPLNDGTQVTYNSTDAGLPVNPSSVASPTLSGPTIIDIAPTEERKQPTHESKQSFDGEWEKLGQKLSTLQAMGFTYELAEMAVVTTQTLEEAIEFCMSSTVSNDHRFAEDYEWGVDSCTICGKSKAEHILNAFDEDDVKIDIDMPPPSAPVKRQPSKIVEMPDRYEKHPFEAGTGEFCIICSEELAPQDMTALGCGHRFCLNCLDRYFNERIMDGKVSEDRMKCLIPDCKEAVKKEEIQRIVEEKVYTKYLRFVKEAEINANPNARWCPQPRCDGVLWRKAPNETRVVCEKCQFVMCFNCRNPYHGQRSCDKVMEDNVSKWAQENGKALQRCPQCGIQIEKSEGCNHMTCGKCGYQFCWLCRGKYSPNHFAPWNVLGCPALQSGDNQQGCCCRNLIRVGLIFLYLLAIPIFALLCVCSPCIFICSRINFCERVADALMELGGFLWSLTPCNAWCCGDS